MPRQPKVTEDANEEARKFVRDNIEELCEHFFSKGKRVGGSWYIANISGEASEKGGSLEIALAPHDKAGLWVDRATDEKGDFFNLVQRHYQEVHKKELSFSKTVELIREALSQPKSKEKNGQKRNGNLPPFDWDYCLQAMNTAAKRKLAEDRGLSLACVENLVKARMIGRISDAWAFPVLLNGDVVAAQVVNKAKQWFYVPSGLKIGILPLIYGSIPQALEVHFFESPWDMFALIDLLRIWEQSESKAAFVATRGAGNGKLVSRIFEQTKSEARLHAWPQRDVLKGGKYPGEEWLATVCETAHEDFKKEIRRCWIPDAHPEADYDLNDWLREGATQEDIKKIIDEAVAEDPQGELLEKETAELTERYAKDWDIKPGPMREEAYYGLAGEIVRIAVENSECNPEAILLQFLVLVGNASGRFSYVSCGEDKLYTNEYAIIVGPTGRGRKGTALGLAKSPLALIEEYWALSYRKGVQTGEGLIHAIRDPQVKTNRKGEQYVNDPGAIDKRLMITETELSQTLHMAKRNGNTLTTTLRDIWDSPLVLLNINKNSPLKASLPHDSFLGHITKEELLALDPTNLSNGLINRFLWAHAEKLRDFPEAEEIDWRGNHPEIIERLRAAIRKAQPPHEIVMDPNKEPAPSIRRIRKSAEAEKCWNSIYVALNREKKTAMMDSVLVRDTTHILKIALIYALLDQSETIEVPHLKAAQAVADHSQECARYLFGASTSNKLANRILAELKRAPEGMSRKDVSDDVCQRNVTKAELNEAFAHLMSNKLARVEVRKATQKGRNTEVWFAL